MKTHIEVTIDHALNMLEADGHLENFDIAAGASAAERRGHAAFDSDLHKALEGALYALAHGKNERLRMRVENAVDRILAAQREDGFLISYYIGQDREKGWSDLRLMHPMYNAGHFFEMAVEHFRLTGDPKALDAACRFADHIDRIFGPGKRYDVDGHQEVELALVKLYRATGERRYLELSRFFIEERGYAHGMERKPFEPASEPPPAKPEGELTPERKREFWHAQLRHRNGRMQDHKPVVEQHEAIGHAVRACYMYAAMVDILRFMDAPGYERALDSIWHDVVERRMYLTGNVGTGQYDDEGFGDPYLLPNESAYCESCAAIAHVLWQHRMNLLNGQAGCADVMELALYNGMLSGISIAGNGFFYQNPLAGKGKSQRRSWIGIACCPTNFARIIPQVGGLAYAVGEGRVLVNLYLDSEATFAMDGGVTLRLVQRTDYPWDGRVRIEVSPEQPGEFTLCLRIPGWARGKPVPGDLYRFEEEAAPRGGLEINGAAADFTPQSDGYVHLKRCWRTGDVVELDLPMPVRRVYAHANVRDDQGKVALMRGPIVYCVEEADHPNVDLFRLVLPPDAELTAEHREELLGGVTIVRGQARDDHGNPVAMTAVPYYAWANRESNAMTVWIDEPSR